jgi:hypothetical protein
MERLKRGCGRLNRLEGGGGRMERLKSGYMEDWIDWRGRLKDGKIKERIYGRLDRLEGEVEGWKD